jgi:cell division protein FtsI/penicillin-binding protein 2
VPFAAALGAVAFAGGLVCGALHTSAADDIAKRFAAAWRRGDYPAMYAVLSPDARRHSSLERFVAAYRTDRVLATARRMAIGEPVQEHGAYRLPVGVDTRVFGTIDDAVVLPIHDAGGHPTIEWRPHLAFPGLRPGETLTRRTHMPPRAALLARDRTPLAQGPVRSSPLGPLAASVVGVLGAAPPERSERLEALGVPPGTRVGVTGLERIFDERLLGRPGGELLAGPRVLGRGVARAAGAVRTTISAPVQQAAVTALAGRLGGAVALKPRTGEILAFAGIAFSGLQPPGSTFKMITVTGALEAAITSPSKAYPVETKAVLEGVALENANGESCGGTLVESFARSCNSVFAPMGAAMGARRLVAVAERFGFNRAPGIPGAATSTIPAAGEIGDALAVGSSAIGQGRVQATALQMGIVAATIGLRGRRPSPTLDFDAARGRTVAEKATDARTARTVERLMLAVVAGGTGTAAAIPGVAVAGKTGTAELKTTKTCRPAPDDPQSCPPDQLANDPTDTDAWFAAYAPAGKGHPRIAVGVMLVGSGAGGDTAAPAARGLLVAGLKAAQ